jgi:sigma-E factor negative regulatory protein RseC
MAHTKGLVVGIEKDGWAKVIAEKKAECSSCGAVHSCHSDLSNSKIVTKVLNMADAKEGDLVSISLDSGTALKNAAILYLTPIAGLLAGAILGTKFNESLAISETSASIALGFTGLFLGFAITIIISIVLAKNKSNIPVISHIIKAKTEGFPYSYSVNPNHKMKTCPECD